MTDSIATRPPMEIFQADRLRWKVETAYPSTDGWTFKAQFITHDDTTLSGVLQKILSTTPEGGQTPVTESPVGSGTWLVDLDCSGSGSPSTQAWQPGFWHWSEIVEKAAAAQRITLRRGTMNLLQSYGSGALTSTGKDFRSWERSALANVEAVLTKKATQDQMSYQIAGRMLSRYSFEELLRIRDLLRGRVDRELEIEAMESTGATAFGTTRVVF